MRGMTFMVEDVSAVAFDADFRPYFRPYSGHPYCHPYNCPEQFGTVRMHQHESPDQIGIRRNQSTPSARLSWSYTIFEGTSEVQRLVIARAVSGIHIP